MISITNAAGVTFNIVEPDDTDFGAEMTRLLMYTMNAAINGGPLIAATMAYVPVDLTVNEGGSITVNSSFIRVTGQTNGGVTLSASALAPGARDGLITILAGQDDSRTVTILDNQGTIDINGDVTLAKNEMIHLIWNATTGKWNEISRTA
jgi:hypothetical protein